MITILIVEDDGNLNTLFQSVLNKAGFQTLSAGDGEEALTILDEHHVDLIITDIMMPKMDGFELAKELREAGYMLPILVITAKESFEDKRRGFGIGVDDYMVKPIDVNEMTLRVEALLRRARIAHEKELKIGSTTLNQETYEVGFNGKKLELPQKEFQLLYKLLSYPNKIFTRQQLMDEIWGMDSETDERTIDVHIKRLRDKFQSAQDFQILTIRGWAIRRSLRYEKKTTATLMDIFCQADFFHDDCGRLLCFCNCNFILPIQLCEYASRTTVRCRDFLCHIQHYYRYEHSVDCWATDFAADFPTEQRNEKCCRRRFFHPIERISQHQRAGAALS